METGSAFDLKAIGPETKYGRAYGMAQFMENIAPWVADMADLPYYADLLFDPLYSIQLAIEYIAFLHDQYDD